MIWGVEDAVATAQRQVDRLGTDYDLRLNTENGWLGTRPVDGEAVNVSVRAWDGLGSVRWDIVSAAEADVQPWDGEVLFVRASSP